MKLHNASNENASVTLKPAEIEEITTFGFNSLSIMQELLEVISEVHDNEENCPICGEDYTSRDAGLDLMCSNDECGLVKVRKLVNEFPQALHTLKTIFD